MHLSARWIQWNSIAQFNVTFLCLKTFHFQSFHLCDCGVKHRTYDILVVLELAASYFIFFVISTTHRYAHNHTTTTEHNGKNHNKWICIRLQVVSSYTVSNRVSSLLHSKILLYVNCFSCVLSFVSIELYIQT